MTQTLGFIGAGNMAGAILNGLLKSSFKAQNLMICDLNDEKLKPFQQQGCRTTKNADDIMTQCDAVLLAVKPQVLKQVLTPLAPAAQKHRPLVLSVVAAIPATSIESWLGGSLPIIRTMPNTPALVLSGATGLFANESTHSQHRQFAETVFSGIGTVDWVDNEDLLHAVTAAAGSAPAYFFRFAEAMNSIAKEQGLTDDQARQLIGQTMQGAAQMILQSEKPIEQMRKEVCSPNGTTERAIQSFEKDDIQAMVEHAMRACYDRSVELSEQLAN